MTLQALPHGLAIVSVCNDAFVCAGKVLGDSLLVVRKIENVPVGPNNRPKLPVVVTECGEL